MEGRDIGTEVFPDTYKGVPYRRFLDKQSSVSTKAQNKLESVWDLKRRDQIDST